MGGDTKGIRAGRAFVELSANDTKLQKGLKAASSKLKLWGATMTAAGSKVSLIGGAIVAPMMLAARAFAKSGDDLAEMSARTGASVESLSTLGYAAMKTGVDMGSMETGIKKMQKTLYKAATGSKGAQESLSRLGLTMEDLQGLSPDQQFELLGDRISKIADPTMKAGIAMEIFGRAGTAMIPMMEGGSKAFQRYRDRLAELGGPTSTAAAEAGHHLSKELEDLHFATSRATKSIGAALAPTISKVTNDVIRITVATTTWIKNNQGMAGALFQLGIRLVVVGGALTVIGYGLKAASTGMLLLKGAATSVIGTFKVLSLLAASPWALLAAGCVAAAVAVVSFTDKGKKGLEDMRDTASTVADAMVSAFTRGDITAALQVLGAGLKLEWTKITGQFEFAWNRLCDKIAEGIYVWLELFGIMGDGSGTNQWVSSLDADLEKLDGDLKKAQENLESFKKKAKGELPGKKAPAAAASPIAAAVAPAVMFGEAQGSFTNASGLRMSAMGTNDALLTATEEIADNTKKLADAAGEDGMSE